MEKKFAFTSGGKGQDQKKEFMAKMKQEKEQLQKRNV